MFNTGLCQDTYEPFCFKLNMLLDTTTLYSIIPVSVTLTFSHGDRVTGKLELMCSVVKLHEVN